VLENGIKWENMGKKGQDSDIESPHLEDPQAFYGTHDHTVDSKGRVALPATFRLALYEQDQGSVVLTNFITDGVRCLDGYSLSQWREFEAKIKEKGRFDPSARTLESYYIARASVCVCDSNGRVNIPTHLREYAGIDRDLVFTSAIHGFRVWRKEVWQLVFSQAESMLLDNPGLFAGVDK